MGRLADGGRIFNFAGWPTITASPTSSNISRARRNETKTHKKTLVRGFFIAWTQSVQKLKAYHGKNHTNGSEEQVTPKKKRKKKKDQETKTKQKEKKEEKKEKTKKLDK